MKEADDQIRHQENVQLALASLLTQGATDARFTIFLHPADPEPALVCFYNLEAFRHHYRNLWLFVTAFGEVCRQLNDGFDPTSIDAKAWEDVLLKQRPDVAEKASLLARDPDFLRSFAKQAETFANQCMQFTNLERIRDAVGAGTDLLTIQARENVLTIMHESAGLDRRGAKSKQRSTAIIARQFIREHMNLKNGRNGVKSKAAKPNYEKLRKAVCKLDGEEGTIPNKKDVAADMGFSGANRDESLGNWMKLHRDLLMQTHNHTTHTYRQVAKEILDRRYSNPL